MKRKKILLPSKKFFKAQDEDINLSLNLEDNQKLLREGDRDIILNISELFDKERNESKNYKIYGKLKLIFKNLYYGTPKYTPINKFLYPYQNNLNLGYLPYNEYALLRNDILREFYDYDSNPRLSLKGTEFTGHTITTNYDAPYKNWNLFLSYVYSGDTQYPMKYSIDNSNTYSFLSGDGIPFLVKENTKSYTLTSPIDHGMKSGEYVVISGEIYSIIEVGDETYNSEKYVLKIPKTTIFDDGGVVLGKRCIDIINSGTTTSTYYVQKHKIITNEGDYIIDNAGFEKSIWKDERKLLTENIFGEKNVSVEKNRMETLLYDFKNPIVLENMLNNLGYTPTELFVSVVFRNGNGYFQYPPKVGFDFNFHDTWVDRHFYGTNKSQPPFETNMDSSSTVINGVSFDIGNSLVSGDTLTGAFVEYNDYEMKERVISESFHKIVINKNVFDHNQTTTVVGFSGATENNPFGLFYQPHYKVKIRQLSPYIETSDTEEIYNLPENTKYYPNEKLWKWRDLYDHGYIDSDGFGTNFPFANNTHYVKNDIHLYLRNERYSTNKNEGLIKFINKNLNC